MQKLVQWSKQFANLPWRQNRGLYQTLVSEIMLQQTTVGTVLNHFDRFLKKYPNLQVLADAAEEDLTISWKGLGYYRRARNLKKACVAIVDIHKGKIPLDRETLLTIPGIGPYTSSALIAIGANQPELAIDANIERVLARLYNIKVEQGAKLQKELRRLYDKGLLLDEIRTYGARQINEALMDLGRNICRANQAYCDICPVAENCLSFKNNNQLKLPHKVLKIESKGLNELVLLRLIVIENGSVFVYRKSREEWLAGQWELPTFTLYSDDQNFTQYPCLNNYNLEHLFFLPTIKTGITKYSIDNKLLILNEMELEALGIDKFNYDLKMISKSENFSTATFKALEYFKLIK